MGEREIDQYKKLHAIDWIFSGQSTLPHGTTIAKLVRRFEPASLLDYGCGKGRQYSQLNLHKVWGGILPTLYDPAVEPFAQRPELREEPLRIFDGVICCDVAEHIPQTEVPEFLRDVLGYAAMFVFITISTVPATKLLPDKRNCHLTVQPARWWLHELEAARKAIGKSRGSAPELCPRFLP